VNAWRRYAIPPVTLLLAALIGGCALPPIPGEAPLRYRDPVFSDVIVNHNLVYGHAPNAQGFQVPLDLDLYRPAGDTQTSRPALVWLHGGAWSFGDKNNTIPVDVANTFAKLGYVVILPNYRLLGSACGVEPFNCESAAIESKRDTQAAVRWLRAYANVLGVDPTRIAVGGESAGGVIAALVGLQSEDVGSSGNPGWPSTVRGFVSVSGGLPISGLANAGDAPGLFFHGTADPVPVWWSQDTADAMLAAGVPAFMQIQEGAGHVPWDQYRSLYIEQSVRFLYLYLELARAAGQPPAAARAAERQLQELGASPQAERLQRKHPELKRARKRIRQLVR